LQAALGAGALGPDALELTADALRQRLHTSRRAIKVALLDQRAVAGIGNLYASEILHHAAIDPRTRCTRLTRGQWEKIHAATQEVLRTAIKYEGSTLSDGTYRNALNQSGGYQNHHRVYDRAGESCPRCKNKLVRRIVQTQRSTFYCPGCQRR
jgi:formamidopyrimidine-DNA glycosylase